MEITRTSLLSGKTHTRDIDVTFEQLQQWEVERKPIQQVMEHLSDADREFIMTGITDEEWKSVFEGT